MSTIDLSRRSLSNTLYQAVWRWHFIIGLVVLPFLLMMAITGGLYLFKNEIEHFVYRDWQQVAMRSTPPLALSAVIARVERDTHGKVLQFVTTEHANDSIKLVVRATSGESRTVYADPYDGHVLGSTQYGGAMQFIRKLHSLQRFGFWASCLIEITAGWTIILVVMGLFLWWPRGAGGGVVTVRGTPTARVFWRDVHAVLGMLAASIILFLALTGMPWSQVWGNRVQAWAASHGWGEPAAPANVIPDWQIGQAVEPATSSSEHVHNALPWALENASIPNSATGERTPLNIDHVLHLLKQAGLQKNFTVTLPSGPTGAYMGAYRPDRTEETRVIYLDQYTGAVLGDVGYKQYGSAAKLIEWGIAVHQGTEYGVLNRYLMLFGCIAILLLAVSSLAMWLKRKPRGSFGVPQRPSPSRAVFYVLASVWIVAIVFPLVGASLIVVWLLESARHKINARGALNT